MIKITDVSKLENTINSMVDTQGMYTSSSAAFIGKTENKCITITVFNRDAFEREFNEDFNDFSVKHFCLTERDNSEGWSEIEGKRWFSISREDLCTPKAALLRAISECDRDLDWFKMLMMVVNLLASDTQHPSETLSPDVSGLCVDGQTPQQLLHAVAAKPTQE
ncbi:MULTISPECIES: hypothetical protein [unclassified Serratia (in: enterobacteria)]|uniref:hypothetical protein n=1 Tax=unclassified Serratia (in: enterobacteria) TaxID=2647522 RepID=UPI0004696F3D|nr:MULTISPECIES: hypothetical protein [unclassified Serratia (in: enterobacteria)]